MSIDFHWYKFMLHGFLELMLQTTQPEVILHGFQYVTFSMWRQNVKYFSMIKL